MFKDEIEKKITRIKTKRGEFRGRKKLKSWRWVISPTLFSIEVTKLMDLTIAAVWIKKVKM